MTDKTKLITEAIAADDEFSAAVLILRSRGISNADARWQLWKAGPIKGQEVIGDWLADQPASTTQAIEGNETIAQILKDFDQ